MNNPGVDDSDLLVRARAALLDALVALEPHRDSVVVIVESMDDEGPWRAMSVDERWGPAPQ